MGLLDGLQERRLSWLRLLEEDHYSLRATVEQWKEFRRCYLVAIDVEGELAAAECSWARARGGPPLFPLRLSSRFTRERREEFNAVALVVAERGAYFHSEAEILVKQRLDLLEGNHPAAVRSQ